MLKEKGTRLAFYAIGLGLEIREKVVAWDRIYTHSLTMNSSLVMSDDTVLSLRN